MSTVAVRELRKNTADVLRRVEAGETITIIDNGIEVADLVPIRRTKRRFIPKDEFFRDAAFADPGLRHDLAQLVGETTEDLPPNR